MPVSRSFNADLARAVRDGDKAAELEARRSLAAAVLEDKIKSVVDKAPPLTAEQRARLAALLAPSTDRGVA